MNVYVIWSLVLFVVGLVVAVVEVVLPSGGLLAVAAIACLGGSLACAYQWSGVLALTLAAVEAVSVPAIVYFAFKVLPKTAVGRQLILSPPPPKRPPAVFPSSPAGALGEKFASLLGKEGTAVTMLRPSGTVELNDRRLSVVTGGEVVPAGSRVRVVHVEGNRVVVEAVERQGESPRA